MGWVQDGDWDRRVRFIGHLQFDFVSGKAHLVAGVAVVGSEVGLLHWFDHKSALESPLIQLQKIDY